MIDTMLKNNIFFRISSLIVVVCLCFSITSCNFDETKNNFHGGEILDQDIIESIRDALSNVEASAETTEYQSEKSEQTEQTELQSGINGNETSVFWAEGGSVWHTYEDCRYIDDKDCNSGYVTDAINAGKERLCSACKKRAENETLETEDSETETSTLDLTDTSAADLATTEPDKLESVLTETEETEPFTTEIYTTEYITTETIFTECETMESDTTEMVTTECETAEQECEKLSDEVYWIESGEVWHNWAECRYIKGKSFISGTVEQAMSEGKLRLCSVCDKRDSDSIETFVETESESTEALTEVEQTEETETENFDATVYWIESGSVWHNDPECAHIKGKDYVTGTVEEAKQQGKDRVCKSCGD